MAIIPSSKVAAAFKKLLLVFLALVALLALPACDDEGEPTQTTVEEVTDGTLPGELIVTNPYGDYPSF